MAIMSISCPFNANATDWKCFELIWELLSILILLMIFDFLESFWLANGVYAVFNMFFCDFSDCLIDEVLKNIFQNLRNIQYSESLLAGRWPLTEKNKPTWKTANYFTFLGMSPFSLDRWSIRTFCKTSWIVLRIVRLRKS